jgi:glycerophosphoryl diester phosphodiesterase
LSKRGAPSLGVVTGRPLILAHRGASRRARENTLEAFAAARADGADGVELDVRRTADGVPVVHHDPAVPDVGLIVGVRFAALRHSAPFVPTLAEALTACAGLLVNVELKCLPWEADADPEHVVARHAVDLIRDAAARVVVSSFDLGAIDAVRAYAGELETGFLVHGQEIAAVAPLARARGHDWLHPDRVAVLADPARAVAACRAEGLRIDVWTVDDPDEMRTLAAAGVDAIVTNVPDVALATLQ